MISRRKSHLGALLVSLFVMGLISGCSFFSAFGPEETATPEPRILVPTFTPTPEGQQAAVPEPATPQPVDAPAESQPAATAEPVEERPAEDVASEPPTPDAPPTDTPPPPAQLSVLAWLRTLSGTGSRTPSFFRTTK